VTEQDDDIANAEREAHRGRPADAVPWLAKVLAAHRRRLDRLEARGELVERRLEKLEDREPW
jgi:hypothetical protein